MAYGCWLICYWAIGLYVQKIMVAAVDIYAFAGHYLTNCSGYVLVNHPITSLRDNERSSLYVDVIALFVPVLQPGRIGLILLCHRVSVAQRLQHATCSNERKSSLHALSNKETCVHAATDVGSS